MAETDMVREPGRNLRDIVDRLFDERFLDGPLSRFWDEGLLPVDISESGSHVIVRASLPGYKKEDIEIQVNEGVISIKAEQTSESETKDERFYRKERRYGAMSRRVALPGIVAGAEAEAELKDGVLIVRVPISEQSKPKRVEIKD